MSGTISWRLAQEHLAAGLVGQALVQMGAAHVEFTQAGEIAQAEVVNQHILRTLITYGWINAQGDPVPLGGDPERRYCCSHRANETRAGMAARCECVCHR